jgi:hypothetical protein
MKHLIDVIEGELRLTIIVFDTYQKNQMAREIG